MADMLARSSSLGRRQKESAMARGGGCRLFLALRRLSVPSGKHQICDGLSLPPASLGLPLLRMIS